MTAAPSSRPSRDITRPPTATPLPVTPGRRALPRPTIPSTRPMRPNRTASGDRMAVSAQNSAARPNTSANTAAADVLCRSSRRGSSTTRRSRTSWRSDPSCRSDRSDRSSSWASERSWRSSAVRCVPVMRPLTSASVAVVVSRRPSRSSRRAVCSYGSLARLASSLLPSPRTSSPRSLRRSSRRSPRTSRLSFRTSPLPRSPGLRVSSTAVWSCGRRGLCGPWSSWVIGGPSRVGASRALHRCPLRRGWHRRGGQVCRRRCPSVASRTGASLTTVSAQDAACPAAP